MLYYGNKRSDGTVIQPHELVYNNYILNCLTGVLDINETEVNISIDDNPIDFLAVPGDYNYTLNLFIIYSDYTKLYIMRDSFDIVKIKNIGKFNHSNCIVDGKDIKVKVDSHKKIYNDFMDKCKQVVHVFAEYCEMSFTSLKLVYIDQHNKVHHDDDSYTLFNRFIIINCCRCLRIYDIEKEILYDGYNRLFYDFNKIDNIKDIKVYRDNIEVYTSKENYYIHCLAPQEHYFKVLPDGWSVKPRFNMRSKSARKID